jgi:gliding motility-associated-like protein
MNVYKRILLSLSFILSFLLVNKVSKASHFYGADFYYSHVIGNTYKVYLVVYGDCSGTSYPSFPGSQPQVVVYNNGNSYDTLTLTIQAGSNVEVTPVCDNQINNTVCSNPLSTIPGVKRFIYAANVTLNALSANWVFQFNGVMGNSSAGRSNSITNITIGPTTGSIISLIATLNNLSGPNSSPVYTTIPTPFFCINKPAAYNPGAIDPNSDSLNFSLVNGLEPAGTVTYVVPFTGAAPLATAAGAFNFNNANGQLNFTPNAVQKSLVVGQVEEYKNGVLVGTSMREMTFVVINNCNNNPPVGNISNNSAGSTLIDTTTIKICKSNGTLTFNINPTDIDGNTINVAANGLPLGATFSISNNNTTNPIGAFSWNLATATPGTYTFFITYEDNGCPLVSKQTQAYTIIVLPNPSSAVSIITQPVCSQKGQIKIIPNGGTPPLHVNILQGTTTIFTQYNASGPIYDSLFYNPGGYTVRTTDTNACFSDTTIILNTPITILPNITKVAPNCYNGNNGSITITNVVGAVSPIQYAIGTGAYGSNNVFSNLTPGTYTIHIKDANNCIKDTVVVVPNTTPIGGNIVYTKPPCNAFQNGAIAIVAFNGTAPYQYALGAGPYSANNIFTNLYSGTYVIHIKDAVNCIRDTTVTLLDSINVHATVSTTNNLCFGQSLGTVSIVGNSGTSPYSYALGSGIYTAATTYVNLSANTFLFHVKDVNGCYLDTLITITQPNPLVNTLAITPVSCYGLNNGSVAISTTGGTPTYQYAIGTNAWGSNATFSNLAPGTYTFHIKDANNCSKDTTATITQPSLLGITASFTKPLCFGENTGTITIGGVGGTTAYTYAIGTGTYSNNPLFTGISAGTYVLHVKDANNCIKDTTISITQPSPLQVTASVVKNICSSTNTGKITLTANGGTPTYQYAIGTNAYSNSAIFSNLAAGTYTLHIKDANNCIKDTTLTIQDSIVVGATVSTTNISCNGLSNGVIIANGNAGIAPYTYAINTSTYNLSNVFSNLSTGSYTIHVKDINGCIKDTTVSITAPPPVAVQVTLTNPLCNGGNTGSLLVTGSGGTPGYSYAYNSNTFGPTNNFTALLAGTYVLHVIDSKGCTKDTTVSLVNPSPVQITLTTTPVLCFGDNSGTATISASGGTPTYTYAFDANPYQASNILTGLNAGTHVVHVSDNNNCIKDTTISIAQPTEIKIINAPLTNATCPGYKDGVASVNGTGGIAPYTYSIDGVNFGSNNVFTTIGAGTYTLTIKDANGCIKDTTVTITELPPLTFPNVTITPVSCYGYKDGQVTIVASGGKPSYLYLMVPATLYSSQNTFSNLFAGAYTIKVKDSKNCLHDTLIQIPSPDSLQIQLQVTNNNCVGNANASIVSIVQGGTQPYAYTWNPFSNDPSIFNLTNGVYVLYVQDAHNCKDTATATVRFDNCCLPFIPNAFTPNNDGNNDRFRIKFVGDITIERFSIYNRWGQEVFFTKNPTDSWDGTYNDIPQDGGTFFYYLKGTCGNTSPTPLELKGDVTLIR